MIATIKIIREGGRHQVVKLATSPTPDRSDLTMTHNREDSTITTINSNLRSLDMVHLEASRTQTQMVDLNNQVLTLLAKVSLLCTSIHSFNKTQVLVSQDTDNIVIHSNILQECHLDHTTWCQDNAGLRHQVKVYSHLFNRRRVFHPNNKWLLLLVQTRCEDQCLLSHNTCLYLAKISLRYLEILDNYNRILYQQRVEAKDKTIKIKLQNILSLNYRILYRRLLLMFSLTWKR